MMDITSLRHNAQQIVTDARTNYISPYNEWTSDELRELLVQYQIPIRDSAHTTHDTLVRICDTVFGAELGESSDIQESCRKHYTIDEIVRMDSAARIIQRSFIKRQALKKRRQKKRRLFRLKQREQDDANNNDYDYQQQRRVVATNDCEEGGNTHSTGSSDDYDYEMDEYDLEGHTTNYHSSFRRQSMLRRINEQGDDYDEEINVAWRKPSWKFAKRYESLNRPHRNGSSGCHGGGGSSKIMRKYDWSKVTLGRHCYAGGCGEQLDLWNEGRTSEFSQFGSGITNYFKVRTNNLLD